MKPYDDIIAQLPYSHPFLFVDSLQEVTDEQVQGTYTFPEDAFYYQGHFKDQPVTPGVILTEVMAQIGVVCLGIHLLKEQHATNIQIAMTSTQVDFYLPVFPAETVTVVSAKEYFRFQKLKCKVEMFNAKGALVCRGGIAGMVKINNNQ